jgi:hypothetical protein
MFVHRLRVIEGKDGNPLNEVRVLCNSILLNGGKRQVETLPEWPMSGGRSLKLPPEKSVLKLKVGDVVKLSEADFVRLSKAFFCCARREVFETPSDRWAFTAAPASLPI